MLDIGCSRARLSDIFAKPWAQPGTDFDADPKTVQGVNRTFSTSFEHESISIINNDVLFNDILDGMSFDLILVHGSVESLASSARSD